MANPDWTDAQRELAQDRANEDAALAASRAAATRYLDANMGIAQQIGRRVDEFIAVIMRYQGKMVDQSKELARQNGKPIGRDLMTATGRVFIVATGEYVQWNLSNEDFPERERNTLLIWDNGSWRITESVRTSHGGMDDWDHEIIVGYDDDGQLTAPGEEPLDRRYHSEALQAMAAFLTACGLPLPS